MRTHPPCTTETTAPAPSAPTALAAGGRASTCASHARPPRIRRRLRATTSGASTTSTPAVAALNEVPQASIRRSRARTEVPQASDYAATAQLEVPQASTAAAGVPLLAERGLRLGADHLRLRPA